jgi:hypothetical protein
MIKVIGRISAFVIVLVEHAYEDGPNDLNSESGEEVRSPRMPFRVISVSDEICYEEEKQEEERQ